MKKTELLQHGKKFGLQQSIIESLICKETGLTKQQFFLDNDIHISSKNIENLERLYKKVYFGYPIEYALNSAEFYGLELYVDERCLIPRDDTELMVDKVLDSIVDNSVYIDVGIGSGAIPIAILQTTGKSIQKAYAIDISKEALEVARQNVMNYGLQQELELAEGNLLEPLFPLFRKEGTRGWSHIFITANLPYIKDEDYNNMDKEVILHEPSVALYGGNKTGFELYEKLIEQIENSTLLQGRGAGAEGVFLFIEIGFDQKEIAEKYLNKKNLDYQIFKDNGGVERCVRIVF